MAEAHPLPRRVSMAIPLPARWIGWTLCLSFLVPPDLVQGQNVAPAWSFAGGQPGAHLGHSVSSAGDVNGDGYGDVLVGAPDAESGKGAAFLFLGSRTGLALT